MIRSSKRCLIKCIGRALLCYNELGTILTEIENVLNSRPLTYMFDDSEGISYPLRPAQLINGRNLNRTPNEAQFEIVNTYETSKRAKYHRKLLHEFSRRWKNEYLLNLLESYKPKGTFKNPYIDIHEVCILRNDQIKRSF